MKRRVHAIRPEPDARVRTELVIASDGAIYVAIEPGLATRRKEFVGYALDPMEVAILGNRLLLAWASTALLGLGTDGRVYVNAKAMGARRGRAVFRGVKANQIEAARMIEELHRTAFNLTIAARGH